MSIRNPLVISGMIVAIAVVSVATTVIAYDLICVPQADETLLEHAMAGPTARVYGDLRDGIMAPPDDPEVVAHYERFGITRRMLEDPSIMTAADVQNLENAITVLIAENWDDFQAMMNYASGHGLPRGATGVTTASFEDGNTSVHAERVDFGPFSLISGGRTILEVPE